MSPEEIIDAVQNLGYECTMLEGAPYLRYDFYSTDMDEAQALYYSIGDDLFTVGLGFDDPYIEHDCITGNVVEVTER